MADDDNPFGARTVILRDEGSPEHRPDAEELEKAF